MSKAVRKVWKDAATLIITGRTAKKANSSKNTTGLTGQITPSSIKVSEQGSVNALERTAHEFPDFEILMLKRSGKSGFMPNAHVFPGGIVDKADFSKEWLDIFKSSGFSKDAFCSLIDIPGPRPPVYAHYTNCAVRPEVAFRICALREAFEESGVLLLKGDEKIENQKLAHDYYLDINNDELWSWRQKIHKDATNFIDLCRHLNRVPDIWSLKEWSNWLTPVESNRRYDTMFYICTLERKPQIEQDHHETVQAIWNTPMSYLKEHFHQNLWLAPPQAYELSRIVHFENINELADFSASREQHGIERWLPVRYQCDDGYLSLFPGDDLYTTKMKGVSQPQSSVNWKLKSGKDVTKIEGTFRSLKEGLTHLRRLEMKSRHEYNMVDNTGSCGHCPLDMQLNIALVNLSSSSKF